MKKIWKAGPQQTALGDGVPKICIPIVAQTEEEILKKAQEIRTLPAEVVEWRADFYEEILEDGKLEEMLGKLRQILDRQVLLYTFRSQAEGGHRAIGAEDYRKLNERAAASGCADLVDVEAFMEEACTEAHLKKLTSYGVGTIASNHDFFATPSMEQMLARLKQMENYGASIAKLAVMPNCPQDVQNVLQVTQTAQEELKIPVITMSMGTMGMTSRISGKLTGSALTFASAGEASAPGQIPVEKMRMILDLLS